MYSRVNRVEEYKVVTCLYLVTIYIYNESIPYFVKM